MELLMSKTDTVSPLRQRMIEDMAARKLNPHTQRSHIQSRKRFAAWLKRSPDTATPDDVRRFQLYLIESGSSICNRNRIMTGVRLLFRVTLRRHDLAAEVWHLKLADKRTFKRFIGPLRHSKCVVYCKAPFAGPKQVLRYLSRYTHRVAISNRRLIAADDAGVAFRWKDYRADGPARWKTMRFHPHEFIRRFLLHVLPKGFHRIRHYGILASANRAKSIAKARVLLSVAPPAVDTQKEPDITPDTPPVLSCPCPHCGARMIVIEIFARGCEPRWRPAPSRIDTS
jgi:hypothetical protein